MAVKFHFMTEDSLEMCIWLCAYILLRREHTFTDRQTDGDVFTPLLTDRWWCISFFALSGLYFHGIRCYAILSVYAGVPEKFLEKVWTLRFCAECSLQIVWMLIYFIFFASVRKLYSLPWIAHIFLPSFGYTILNFLCRTQFCTNCRLFSLFGTCRFFWFFMVSGLLANILGFCFFCWPYFRLN